MIDERAYELALSQLAQAREEKMLLFEQVKRLTEEVALLIRRVSVNRILTGLRRVFRLILNSLKVKTVMGLPPRSRNLLSTAA